MRHSSPIHHAEEYSEQPIVSQWGPPRDTVPVRFYLTRLRFRRILELMAQANLKPAAPSWSGRMWQLPPLILHPFTAPGDAGRLGGFLASEAEAAGRDDIFLEARYRELRMLYFIGRDVMRWIDQCMDFASRTGALALAGLREQSFAELLVENVPPSVHAKLEHWGVLDYRSIFARAIALNLIFREPPETALLMPQFLRNFCGYTDAIYTAYRDQNSFTAIGSANFSFDLFSSREYTAKLESEWRAE